MSYRIARVPRSRADYLKFLLKAWKPDWLFSKSDIRQMSLKSLREGYKNLQHYNYIKVMGQFEKNS